MKKRIEDVRVGDRLLLSNGDVRAVVVQKLEMEDGWKLYFEFAPHHDNEDLRNRAAYAPGHEFEGTWEYPGMHCSPVEMLGWWMYRAAMADPKNLSPQDFIEAFQDFDSRSMAAMHEELLSDDVGYWEACEEAELMWEATRVTLNRVQQECVDSYCETRGVEIACSSAIEFRDYEWYATEGGKVLFVGWGKVDAIVVKQDVATVHLHGERNLRQFIAEMNR
jgi:hypothetical protein